MIIGPGCSSGTVKIAELAPFFNLTQVGNMRNTNDAPSASCYRPLNSISNTIMVLTVGE